MYLDQRDQRYVVIGTVYGYGYICKLDKVFRLEGSNNGLWNKVSNWVDFIKGVMHDMGEPDCY